MTDSFTCGDIERFLELTLAGNCEIFKDRVNHLRTENFELRVSNCDLFGLHSDVCVCLQISFLQVLKF